MSTRVQFRRGTTEQHATFIGAEGEITVDTEKKTILVHDGITAGGNPVGGGYVYNTSSGPTQSVSFAQDGIHQADCTGGATFTFDNPADVARVDLILNFPGSYDNVSFSVSSQDSNPYDIAFSSDGTKMFMIGLQNNSVHQYSLSTAWNIGSASYDNVSFSVNSQDGSPFGIAFSSDGTKMFMVGGNLRRVFQYSLTTAWDISSASYDNVSFSVGSQDGAPYGIAFSSDGTKMFVLGLNRIIFQYTLGTAWNVSTASFDNVSFSVSQDSSPRDITFSSDGTKMFMVGSSNDSVYQYTLSTAWDLSTASYDNVFFSVSSQDSTPLGIAFSSDGTKMFMVGVSTDSVYQYTTGGGYFPILNFPNELTNWNDINANGKTALTIITDDGGTTYEIIGKYNY